LPSVVRAHVRESAAAISTMPASRVPTSVGETVKSTLFADG